jgi:hypothetical protein
MGPSRASPPLVLAAFFVLAVPSVAAADWTFAAFLGASFTRPNTLALDRPAFDTHVTFGSIRYDARSFESPVYYGYRAGWLGRSRIGVEIEFIHLKAYARTSDRVSVAGRVRGSPYKATAPMRTIVERFSISHGLNLVFVNLTWHAERVGRVVIAARGGAGFAVPHGESTIDGVAVERYGVAGAAFQGASGVELIVGRGFRALAEYKLTSVRPEIAVADGTIAGRFVTHHAVLGLAWQRQRGKHTLCSRFRPDGRSRPFSGRFAPPR